MTCPHEDAREQRYEACAKWLKRIFLAVGTIIGVAGCQQFAPVADNGMARIEGLVTGSHQTRRPVANVDPFLATPTPPQHVQTHPEYQAAGVTRLQDAPVHPSARGPVFGGVATAPPQPPATAMAQSAPQFTAEPFTRQPAPVDDELNDAGWRPTRLHAE